jgi:hypothetical protein
LIETSTRFVPHIVALVVLAGIPTVLHSLGRFDVEDCAAPTELLATPGPDQAPMLSTAERQRFDGFWGAGNWSAGTLPPTHDGGARLQYVIARSYDPKAVYHWPETRVEEARPIARGLEDVEGPGERIPVHRAFYEGAAAPMMIAYLLVYDSEAIANPYLAQILSGPRQVVMGRRPMWLFMVYGKVDESRRADAEARAREWLAAAPERYRAACAQEAPTAALKRRALFATGALRPDRQGPPGRPVRVGRMAPDLLARREVGAFAATGWSAAAPTTGLVRGGSGRQEARQP